MATDSSVPDELDPQDRIEYVLVVGAGWVGRQIVGQMAAHGIQVSWMDQSSEALSSGIRWILDHRESIVERGKWPPGSAGSIEARITTTTDLETIQRRPGLVLESVTEQISIKRKVLQSVSSRFDSPTILASNSSYFTPSMLDRFVSRPERFANFHFHVPVWITQLVDIAAGKQTAPSTLHRLQDLAVRIGQHPLVQTVENPGYVFNWLLRSLLQASLQLLDRGVASPQQIDMAWKRVTKMPIGPFGMMDQIGIDLIHQTMSAARFVDGDAVWQPLIDQLQPLIDSNQLGVKTGAGFFDYGGDDPPTDLSVETEDPVEPT
jgi:3-hydroxybutyryl-CoA dehydrogenase